MEGDGGCKDDLVLAHELKQLTQQVLVEDVAPSQNLQRALTQGQQLRARGLHLLLVRMKAHQESNAQGTGLML